jgi:hypothetical protein
MSLDVAELKKMIESENHTAELAGTEFNKMRINVYDVTDFDALTELENFIQTGRKVHHIQIVSIPHIVVVSSPARK